MQLKQFYTTFIDRPSFLNVSNALHAFRIFLVVNEIKEEGKSNDLATCKRVGASGVASTLYSPCQQVATAFKPVFD